MPGISACGPEGGDPRPFRRRSRTRCGAEGRKEGDGRPLTSGPGLSVVGESDVQRRAGLQGELGRSVESGGTRWASAHGGKLGRAGGAGCGVREKEEKGWATSV